MKEFRTIDTVACPKGMNRIEFEASMLELADFAKKCGLKVIRENFGNRIALTGNRFQFIRYYLGNSGVAQSYFNRVLLFMKKLPK